ncbi:Aste57867_18662 [Aphanomyces stellatus]|uniref:Aste57867_18662 protein n=1 Tax=Aphanomyces stellatus TaxID=120398 RepID=A0A485LBK3_9STRA|nr:hypothetical protein As57867_018600 [Aphanomyces stellatus]VFT95397.1 Aste57867_18662 [Aphanomyces stellatus]
MLFASGANVDCTLFDGVSSLMLASAHGHPEIVSMLLAAGANVDSKQKDDITALMLASGNGWVKNVKLLLDAGANVKCADNDGVTRFHAAAGEALHTITAVTTHRIDTDDLRCLLPSTATIVGPLGMTKAYEVMRQVKTSLHNMHIDVQSSLNLNKEVLAMTQGKLTKVVETKAHLMRGIFEANEVHVPTTFIVLPFNMAEQRDDASKSHQEMTMKKATGFLQRLKFVGVNIVAAVKESNPLAATKAALDGLKAVNAVRGSTLCELERFYAEKDPNKTFAGVLGQ